MRLSRSNKILHRTRSPRGVAAIFIRALSQAAEGGGEVLICLRDIKLCNQPTWNHRLPKLLLHSSTL